MHLDRRESSESTFEHVRNAFGSTGAERERFFSIWIDERRAKAHLSGPPEPPFNTFFVKNLNDSKMSPKYSLLEHFHMSQMLRNDDFENLPVSHFLILALVC